MSNAVYPKALDALAVGTIDYVGDTIKVQLLDATYTYSTAHEFIDDITGTIGTAETLTGTTVTDGEFFADDAVLAAVATGHTVKSFVVYVDTGTPGTSHVLAYIDTRADTVPISLATNGGDITVEWPSNRVFKI